MFERKIQLTDQCMYDISTPQSIDGRFIQSITTVERLKDLIYMVQGLNGLRILIEICEILFLWERSKVLCCELRI